jgi:influenza virus NS1A-binding protein
MSEINVARTKFGSVSVKGERIYVLGGELLDGSRTDLIDTYEIKSDVWSISDLRLPSSRSDFSTVPLNEKQLLVIGGNDGQVFDCMDLLNLENGEWSSLPSMHTKRDELAVTVGPDGKIYAIGGYGGQNSTCLKSVERFDFQTYEWGKVADLNEPRRALACVSLFDGVYAIGGYNNDYYLSSMEKYDEIAIKWVKLSSMNSPRCTLSAVSSNDCQYIYTIGGFDSSFIDCVEKYDQFNDRWEYCMRSPKIP